MINNNSIKQKSQSFCIFCNKSKLSKEHIWADWLSPYIPNPSSHTTHLISNYSSISKSLEWKPGRHHNREGDPSKRKLRIVCKKCNNGWMSELQVKAKPILELLIAGKWSDLSKIEQNILASWVTMFVIVYEWTDQSKVALTQEERTYFMNNKFPPDYWNIWIGKYCGQKEIYSLHTGLGLYVLPV